LEPAQAKKKKKRAGRVAQVVGPEFKPQYHQKKKKKESVGLGYFRKASPLALMSI
jgi:hypothetical protein